MRAPLPFGSGQKAMARARPSVSDGPMRRCETAIQASKAAFQGAFSASALQSARAAVSRAAVAAVKPS